MSKRKASKSNKEDDDSDSDVSLIDVDFDFFDPNPNVDYHALKRLLTQLFQSDAERFHLHEFAELILGQPTVGTTVKTDGLESDPYAVLTVLNMHVHQNHPSIKALADYALLKSAPNPPFNALLQSLFQQNHHVGFVFCERLINMPVQVIPPMYRMLSDELGWAVDDNEPYIFSHLLFISRTYCLSPEEESMMASTTPPSSKRQKRPVTHPVAPTDGIFSFHPEDDCIKQYATHLQDYEFTTAQPRDKDSFGLDTRGRMMLVPAEKFPELVAKMSETYAVPA